jgi:type II restriction enzyme
VVLKNNYIFFMKGSFMSNANKLSETITGLSISNEESTKQEEVVAMATEAILYELRSLYPKIQIWHEKGLSKIDIGLKLKEANKDCGSFISNEKSYIKPDGGFIFAEIKGEKRLILASEAKKQGTNKKRIRSGFKKQASGNAVERAFKNPREVENWLIDTDFNPYVIFFSGCDFAPGSSIIDRITGMNFQQPLNTLRLKKIPFKVNGKTEYKFCTTVYVQEKQWSKKEVFERLLLVAKRAINHHKKSSRKVK